MAHHIVAALALAALGVIVVNIVLMGLQFGNLLIGNGQALLLLGARQGDPQPSPGAKLVVLGKDELHLRACIPGGKGADIPGMIGHGAPSYVCKKWDIQNDYTTNPPHSQTKPKISERS